MKFARSGKREKWTVRLSTVLNLAKSLPVTPLDQQKGEYNFFFPYYSVCDRSVCYHHFIIYFSLWKSTNNSISTVWKIFIYNFWLILSIIFNKKCLNIYSIVYFIYERILSVFTVSFKTRCRQTSAIRITRYIAYETCIIAQYRDGLSNVDWSLLRNVLIGTPRTLYTLAYRNLSSPYIFDVKSKFCQSVAPSRWMSTQDAFDD